MTDKKTIRAEIEEALQELADLCDPHIPIQERQMRLAARKEKSKTLRLYVQSLEQESSATTASPESPELSEIRRYLEPLDLAPIGTALPELARLAATRITNQ
jgi:hypothetical protein